MSLDPAEWEKFREAEKKIDELEDVQKEVDYGLSLIPESHPDYVRLKTAVDESRGFFVNQILPAWEWIVEQTSSAAETTTGFFESAYDTVTGWFSGPPNQQTSIVYNNTSAYNGSDMGALPAGIILGVIGIGAAAGTVIYYINESIDSEMEILRDPTISEAIKKARAGRGLFGNILSTQNLLVIGAIGAGVIYYNQVYKKKSA